MELSIALPLSIAMGYSLGSVPWAHLVALRKGVRINEVGTGIAGAANVYRNVGHADGLAVFAADAMMGAIAVLAARSFGVEGWLALPAMAAAILGHIYPALGRFPWGVGLATLGGGVAAMGGWVGVAAVAIGIAAVVLLRKTGAGGAIGMTAFVILGTVSGLQWQTIVGVFLLGVAVLVWSKVRERLQGEPSH